ncbi:hypothetical protein ABZ424_01310 [Streptomyces sp. NPDC005790]|uniref:hypothetical protein n=1 Tax=Streptomyces sp. NPDC005790 TaxID=3154777 RepID=UPI0033DC793F
MADKSSWRNNPHWYLVFVGLLLFALITAGNMISRCVLGVGLTLTAIRYGHESARWVRVKSGKNPDTSS